MFTLFFLAVVRQTDQNSNRSCNAACRFSGRDTETLPPLHTVLPFCFPAGLAALQPREYSAAQHHCFTLTSINTSKLHGFCRLCLPPAPAMDAPRPRRLPAVLCLISRQLWPDLFWKALEMVDKLLRIQPPSDPGFPEALPSDLAAHAFLSQLLVSSPSNGVLTIRLPSDFARISGQIDVAPMRGLPRYPGQVYGPPLRVDPANGLFELQLPPGARPHLASQGTSEGEYAGVPLSRILWYTTPRQLLTIMGALLMERQVVFVAADAEKVTMAVHAAVSMLYPFQWQHVYLPLLPDSLKEYLSAPMPLVAGVLASTLARMDLRDLQAAHIVNLDRIGSCHPEVGSLQDDALLLPFTDDLKRKFEEIKEEISGPNDVRATSVLNDALQSWFCRLLGPFDKFISEDSEMVATSGRSRDKDEMVCAHGRVFDWAGMIAACRRRGNERHVVFMESFRHSQMMEVFVRERLKMRARSGGPADGDHVFIGSANAATHGRQSNEDAERGASDVEPGANSSQSSFISPVDQGERVITPGIRRDRVTATIHQEDRHPTVVSLPMPAKSLLDEDSATPPAGSGNGYDVPLFNDFLVREQHTSALRKLPSEQVVGGLFGRGDTGWVTFGTADPQSPGTDYLPDTYSRNQAPGPLGQGYVRSMRGQQPLAPRQAHAELGPLERGLQTGDKGDLLEDGSYGVARLRLRADPFEALVVEAAAGLQKDRRRRL